MIINYTCSLGWLCHSSQILKRNNYKTCSYPFDWIFSGTNVIIDCLHRRRFKMPIFYKST
jgi:hypothetical protein